MSSSTTISAIIALNTEGIQHLESKDYGQAIASLSTAITDLKLFLANSESSQEAMEFFDQTATATNGGLSFGFDTSSLREQVSSSATTIDSDEEQQQSTPFVFDTPIRVVQRRKRRTSSTNNNERTPHEMLKMLSFALVFNLAISFHMGALTHHHASSSNHSTSNSSKTTTTSPTTKKRLIKALAFYKMTMTMIQNDNLSLGIMESLAVSNNQAQVYQMLGKQQDAEFWKQEVLQSCMYVADCGQQNEVPLFGRFFANCGVVKTSGIAAAA